jgi:hypothetical protein
MRMNSRVRSISSSRIASAAVPAWGSADCDDVAGAAEGAGASARASGATSGTASPGNSAVTSEVGCTRSGSDGSA